MFDFLPIARLIESLGFSKSKVLYGYAKSQIGKVKSGIKAPKEFGCAEATNRIFRECFGNDIGGDVSTTRMYQALLNSPRFVKVDKPQAGDIVISPTGYGSGALSNGHVGIVGEKDEIMSNTSASGKWESNYTISSWNKRYLVKGGFPVHFFRVVL